MRNLKRALSLALASVMLLGMMVVGTSAASYPDVDENDNVEAIEVLNAVNVMIGDRGNFRPDAAVNRHEMAVIMAKLVLGNDVADNYVGSHPFTDTFPWADKYVAACYENDLISGRGGNLFAGNQPLTAVEAASMMLRALGYKDLNKGASDWRAPLVSMANQLRLFNGVTSNPNEQLNRNQVAQLVLNTLKSSVVNLKDNTFDVTNGDGSVVISGGSREYIVRSSRESYAYAINDVESSGNSASGVQGATIELGEHLYNGKLRLNNYDQDVFGRPARTWEYDGREIGSYVKEEMLRKDYSVEVTGKDLYDLLTKNTIDTYSFEITIDGVSIDQANARTILDKAYFNQGNMVRTNTRGVGATGKGVTTEVYVDTKDEIVYISVINTYLAKANEDYNEKKDEVSYTVYALGKTSGELVKDKTRDESPLKVSGEDFAIKDVKKDDLFLVNVAAGEIQAMAAPEIIADTTLSSFSNGSWVNNGTKYDYANTAKYKSGDLNQYSNPNMKEVTYDIILDQYGYLIGIVRNNDPDQYVFLTGLEGGASNLSAKNLDANIIHTDGTMETVTVDMTKSTDYDDDGDGVCNRLGTRIIDAANGGDADANLSQMNTWCTYSVSKSGVYTLTEVAVSTTARSSSATAQFAQDVNIAALKDDGNALSRGKTMKEGRTSLTSYYNSGTGAQGYVYGNDKTVYINAELKAVRVNHNDSGANRMIVNDVDSFTTGVKNVNLVAVNHANPGPSGYLYPEAEIFTLYKDGNVIAVVTLEADDLGTVVDWAIPVDATARQEDYEHEGNGTRAAQPGEWTWYRKAITKDGVVDLTYVGESLDVIGGPGEAGATKMAQGQLYEIRRDANGNVRKSELYTTATHNNYFECLEADDLPSIENIISSSGNRTTVLRVAYDRANFQAASGKDVLTLSNGTLHTNVDDTKGFHVSSDVKTILGLGELKQGVSDTSANHLAGDVNSHTNVKILKDTDTFVTGLDALKNVLDNRLTANFYGYMTVIFEGEAASFIVLDDRYGEVIDEGDNTDRNDSGSTTDYDYTYQSNATNGLFYVAVTAKRPAYLTSAVALTYEYDIYVNNEFWQHMSSSIALGSERNVTSYNGINVNGASVVDIRNFKWTNLSAQTYKVKYYNDTTKAEIVPAADAKGTILVADNDTITTLSAAGTGAALKFKVSNTTYASATGGYRVVGAYNYNGGTPADIAAATGTDLTPGTAVTVNATAKAGNKDGSNYKDYVKVYIDLGNAAAPAPTYGVKLSDALATSLGTNAAFFSADEGNTAATAKVINDIATLTNPAETDDTIKIVASSTSGGSEDVSQGLAADTRNTIYLKATVAQEGSKLDYALGYKITLGTSKGNIVFEAYTGALTPEKTVDLINEDLVINSITVERITTPLEITSVEYDADKLTLKVTFNHVVGKDAANGVDSGAITGSNVNTYAHTKGNSYITIDLKAKLASSQKYTIADAKVYNMDDPQATKNLIKGDIDITDTAGTGTKTISGATGLYYTWTPAS